MLLCAIYAQLLHDQMLHCCCCCCFCCRFILTSFSFCIVQIKSGVSLFVHLLFGCTSVYDFLFYFIFVFNFFLFDLFESSLILCSLLLFAVGLGMSFALAAVQSCSHALYTQYETLNMPQTNDFF